MNFVVPTMVVEPRMLFREGLRRILLDAQFQVFWCEDVPPQGPIEGLSADLSPLVILGSRRQDVMLHVCQIQREYAQACIALMIEPEWQQEILAALHQGVATFIARNCSYSAFIDTLKLALEGATVVPHDLIRFVLTDPQEPTSGDGKGGPTTWDDRIDIAEGTTGLMPSDAAPAVGPLQGPYGLSLRELGVLEGLREGRSNKEIARNLGISEATVKVHVKGILRKSRLRNRTEAAMWSSKFNMEQVERTAGLGSAIELECIAVN